MVVHALVADLMFGSKLKGLARRAGVEVKIVRQPEALTGPAVVDLSVAGGLEAAERLIAAGQRVSGFGSHVDATSLRAARQAGIDPVWTRSQLEAQLPAWLEAACGDGHSTSEK